MITKFNCPCGADKPEDGKEYDGALGYEAIICRKCGRIHDQGGDTPGEPINPDYLNT